MNFKDFLHLAITYDKDDIRKVGSSNIETLFILNSLKDCIDEYAKHIKYQDNSYYIYDELQILDGRLNYLREEVEDRLILLEFAPAMDRNVEFMNILLENIPYILDGCRESLKGIVVNALKQCVKDLENMAEIDDDVFLDTFKQIDGILREYIVKELRKDLSENICEQVNKHYIEYVDKAHNSIRYLYLFQEGVIDKSKLKEELNNLRFVNVYNNIDYCTQEVLSIMHSVLKMLNNIEKSNRLDSNLIDTYVDSVFKFKRKTKHLTNVVSYW